MKPYTVVELHNAELLLAQLANGSRDPRVRARGKVLLALIGALDAESQNWREQAVQAINTRLATGDLKVFNPDFPFELIGSLDDFLDKLTIGEVHLRKMVQGRNDLKH